MTKVTAKNFSFFIRFTAAEFNQMPLQRLRSVKKSLVCEMALRSYEYLVHVRIEDKPTMRDFRAVELLVRRIGAADNTGGIMGVSVPSRVS